MKKSQFLIVCDGSKSQGFTRKGYSPQTARVVKASLSLALAPPGEQPISAMSSYLTSVRKQKREEIHLENMYTSI